MKEKRTNSTVEIKEIGRFICILNNSLRRSVEKSPDFKDVEGFSGKNGWIIGFIAKNQDRPLYQRDFEKEFNITRSTASKVLGLLEKKGYIKRQGGVEGDARLKQIVMTDKAWAIERRMTESMAYIEDVLKKGFSEEELETLFQYMNRIQNNLDQLLKGE